MAQTFTLTVGAKIFGDQDPPRIGVKVYPIADSVTKRKLKYIKDTAGNSIITGHAEAKATPQQLAARSLSIAGLPDPRDTTYGPSGFGLLVEVDAFYFRQTFMFGATEIAAHINAGVVQLEDVIEADIAAFAATTSYVVKPTGGTDGQALVKSGTDVVWGTVAGGGGGGAVASVNTKTGAVVLSASDVGADAAGAATAAQSAAIAAAATDATTKANSAQTAATSAAATDATTKANAAQSAAVQRANHTGSQPSSTISDFSAATMAVVDPQAPAPGVVKTANQRTIVSAFQTGHGWTFGGSPTASNANDTSDAGLGTQCVTFTTATGTAGYIESPTLATPINMTGKTFSLLLKIPAATLDNMSYCYIYAGSGGGFTNYNRWQVRLRSAQQNNQSAYTSGDEWVWVTCPRATMGVGAGTVDLTAINKIRVITSPLAGVQNSIKVGGLATIDQPTVKFPNGAVSLTFDDGYSSVASIVKPYMDKYLMRGTIFPITELIDGVGKVTTANLLDMQRNGWEIALHTATLQAHADSFYASTDAVIRGEMNTASAALAALGLGRPNGFAWPRGQINGTAIKSIKRVTRYGRNNDFASGPETLPPGDPWRIRSWPIGATDSLATLTGLVDAAKTGQSWQVFTIHDILATGATGGQQMNQATFNSLVDYLATSGVPVLPMGEVADQL